MSVDLVNELGERLVLLTLMSSCCDTDDDVRRLERTGRLHSRLEAVRIDSLFDNGTVFLEPTVASRGYDYGGGDRTMLRCKRFK